MVGSQKLFSQLRVIFGVDYIHGCDLTELNYEFLAVRIKVKELNLCPWSVRTYTSCSVCRSACSSKNWEGERKLRFLEYVLPQRNIQHILSNNEDCVVQMSLQ